VRKNFDPEIVEVCRAKFIKIDGSSIYYDPIHKDKCDETFYLYRGVDSDHVDYCIKIPIDVDTSMNSAVCVIESRQVGLNPKRRLDRYENLFKKRLAGRTVRECDSSVASRVQSV
jgi:hypothetical protein